MSEQRIEVDAEGGHRSLLDHAQRKAEEARAQCGGQVGLDELLHLIGQTSFVRYPLHIAYDTVGIESGMFAYMQQCGSTPADGFVLHMHPHFEHRPDDLPLLIAYHLVVVNYGEVADASVAEHFGASLFGMTTDEYYERLCTLADELGPAVGGCGTGGGSCGC